MVITLPYLKNLKKRNPHATLDFLTRREVREIPQSIHLFDRVFAIGGGRNFKMQLLHTLFMLPRLTRHRYDVVIDLQNNEISRLVRRALRPSAWSEFDKVSPMAAGERTRLTIEAAVPGPIELDTGFRLKDDHTGLQLLEGGGWHRDAALVVLNPAGLFPSRNWPLENYVRFAQLWSEHYSSPSQFLVLGLPALSERARYLTQHLGVQLLDLVGRTTAAQAFAILQRATLVLSEDSGLMHMAWVSGIPTIALFGSSRADWSRPLGDHSRCLHSGDLPCGFCMDAVCRYGDTHCLTRYDPAMILDLALELIQRSGVSTKTPRTQE